jgi:hypothetical protein
MSRVKRERFLAKKFLGKKNEALRFGGRRLKEGHCILHAGGSAGGAPRRPEQICPQDLHRPSVRQ